MDKNNARHTANVDGSRAGRGVATPLALLVLCCVVGAALRLYHLGHKSYWLDEAVSLELASWPWAAFVRAVRTTEANMVLYYTLLRPWIHLGGEGETWARLLSCAFGVVTLPVLYLVGVRLFDRLTAVLATGLLALDTGHIWASQEARSYALLVLLTTLSWWLLLRAAASRPGRPAAIAWTLYVVAGALAVYAHFYAVLVLAAQGLALLVLPLPRWRAGDDSAPTLARVPSRVAVTCAVGFAALLSPLVPFLARPHHNIDWIANGARGLHATLQVLGRTIVRPASARGRDELCVLALTGPITVFGAWRRRQVRQARWRWIIPLLWLAVPIVASVAVSLAMRPIIDARYLVICLPPLCLLTAGALTQIWPRWPARALLVLLLVVDVRSLDAYYRTMQNEDWRGATAYVLDHARPGDYAVFFASYLRSPFELYRHLSAVPPSASGPRIGSPAPGFTGPPLELRRWQPLGQTAVQARAQAARVWLFLGHNATPDCEHAVDGYLRGRFTTEDSVEFNLIDIRLYAHPTSIATPDSAQLADIGRYCY